MENNCDFEGITFTNEEMEKLSNILKLSLGSSRSDELYSFFDNTFNTKNLTAIVCPDNRAINLINLMYRAQCAKKNSAFEKLFYTKGSFWANIPYFFSDWNDYSYFTDFKNDIKFIGDIYEAGSELGPIQLDTWDYISEYIKTSQNLKNRDELISCFNYPFVTPCVYTKSKYDSEVGCRFYPRVLVVSAFDSEIHDYISHQDRYRYCFLSKVLQAVYKSHVFSNTNISLSLYERDESNIHELIAKAAAKYNFVSYKRATRGNQDEEYFVRPLKDAMGNIYAFYTLTVHQNNLNGKYVMTPYIIMSDFNYQKGSIPILDNYKKEYDDMSFLNKTKAEALYLILNYNLLLLLERECGEKIITNNRMDIDKIRLNFRGDQSNDLISNLLKYKEPIWSIKQMDDFIFNGTCNSKPLFSNIRETDAKSSIDWGKALEDILVNKAVKLYKKFRNAYDFRTGARNCYYRPGADKFSLSDILNEVEKKGVQNNQDVIRIMGEFLYLTNIGAIDTDLDRDKDKSTYQYTLKIK